MSGNSDETTEDDSPRVANIDEAEDNSSEHNSRNVSAIGRLSLSMNRGRLLVALLVVAVIANAFLGWCLYRAERSEHDASANLSAMKSEVQDRDHAMQVALDYAKGAAEMDFKDLGSWTKRLTANTSPELSKKLTNAADSMAQIIVPLQWVSTPTPITATIRSERNGMFVVNCFVSVVTKNIQAPNGIQSTATYTVTVNRNSNWIITDVGGVDSALKEGK